MLKFLTAIVLVVGQSEVGSTGRVLVSDEPFESVEQKLLAADSRSLEAQAEKLGFRKLTHPQISILVKRNLWGLQDREDFAKAWQELGPLLNGKPRVVRLSELSEVARRGLVARISANRGAAWQKALNDSSTEIGIVPGAVVYLTDGKRTYNPAADLGGSAPRPTPKPVVFPESRPAVVPPGPAESAAASFDGTDLFFSTTLGLDDPVVRSERLAEAMKIVKAEIQKRQLQLRSHASHFLEKVSPEVRPAVGTDVHRLSPLVQAQIEDAFAGQHLRLGFASNEEMMSQLERMKVVRLEPFLRIELHRSIGGVLHIESFPIMP